MGVVYRALDTSLDRSVALKVLRKDRITAEALEQLDSEASITASINHPHVVKVFTTGADQGRFYIAMELVNKGTLHDLIQLQGRVAEIQVLEFAIQIASGLQAAYQAGLIHRDVKPGNILFSDSHTAKIVDFGLAMLVQQAEEAAGGEIWGTPYYIAPEKLDLQPEDVRSDIYSLGATLFHALAGRPPFEAADARVVALKHLKSQAVSLQAFAPWVSGSTAFIVNRTLLKNPDERYQSYDELIQHLEYARAELVKNGSTRQEKKRVILESEEDQKRWSYVTFGMIAFCVLLIGAVFWFMHSPKPAMQHTTLASAASGADAGHSASYEAAQRQLIAGKGPQAAESFRALAQDKSTPAPLLQWCILQQGVAELVCDHMDDARATFVSLGSRTYAANDLAGQKLAVFFQSIARAASDDHAVTLADAKEFNVTNYEAISLFVLGLREWALGRYDNAGALLRQFASTSPDGDSAWVTGYKSLAGEYLADFTEYREAVALLKTAKKPAAMAQAKADVKKIEAEMRRGKKLASQIETMLNSTDDLLKAASKAIDKIRPDLAKLSTEWDFNAAMGLIRKLEVNDDDGTLHEKTVLMRKMQWLIDFEKNLDADVAIRGALAPLKTTDQSVISGIAGFSEKGVELKTGGKVEWKKVDPSSVIELAKALAKAEPDPQKSAQRTWLAGVYALANSRKPEAFSLLQEAAAKRQECLEALAVVFPGVTNASLNSTVSDSGEAKVEESGAKAVDNDPATKWCALGDGPHWLQLDLGKPRTVVGWTVRHSHSGGESTSWNTAEFSLQRSSDGKEWVDMDKVTKESSDVTSRVVVPFSSQYVRLYITKPTQSGASARIYEFAVYTPAEHVLPDLFAPAGNHAIPNFIGANVGDAGDSSSSVDDTAGRFTLVTGGADIWHETDAGRVLSRPMKGAGYIEARVESIDAPDSWAKSGLMFRDSLDPSAANVFLCTTPGNGVSWQVRNGTHQTTTSVIDSSFSAPCWLRIQRDKDTFTAHASLDGMNWKQIGSPLTVHMSNDALACLAVTAHRARANSTTIISEVQIEGK